MGGDDCGKTNIGPAIVGFFLKFFFGALGVALGIGVFVVVLAATGIIR